MWRTLPPFYLQTVFWELLFLHFFSYLINIVNVKTEFEFVLPNYTLLLTYSMNEGFKECLNVADR